MKNWFYTILLLAFSASLFAQGQNVTLFKNLNDYSNVGYSDCWGYVAPDGAEYALLGTDAGVSIVRVLGDPMFTVEVAFVPWVSGPWYDMKTYRHYMYVSSEFSNDILIVDLSPLPDSVHVVGTTISFPTDPHNIFIDTDMGILYVIEDFNFASPVDILDLGDPENPAQIASLGSGLGTDAHDVFAQDSVLYVAEGSSPTLGIFDVSDPANPTLLTRVTVPTGGYVHNVWVTEDNRYMFSTEETAEHTMKVWDIQDLNNVTLVGDYLGNSELAHNVMTRGDYAYLSHYESGLKILDISDPTDVVEVGFYDTYPQSESPNFNGAWGVYPFAEGNRVFVSDIQTGLYIVEFDSVRAGGVRGTVTDLVVGTPLPDVEIEFVEARRAAFSDANGDYLLRTYGGMHTVVFSKPGYFSDTLTVFVSAGDTTLQDVALEQNLAIAAVSVDSLGAELDTGMTVTAEFIIRNDGPGGRLDYVADDINGPLPVLPDVPRRKNARAFEVDQSVFSEISTTQIAPQSFASLLGDTVIVDPAGDLLFGSGGDITGVFATQTATDVTIDVEFLNPVDTDSALIILSLDTDFNAATGAFPGGFGFNLAEQAIGSEFDIILDPPGFFIGNGEPTFYIWEGSNGSPSGSPLFVDGLAVNGNIISITIPLSAIGNDDGNLAIAGFGGHFIPNAGFTSIDYIPDLGNGEIGVNPTGDLPWLSLSQTEGSLSGGEADTITVTFDAAGLESSQVFSGYIAVYTNDVNNPLIGVPVTLTTLPVLGIDDDPAAIETFQLAQNYPNPFNPSTRIEYRLAKTARVTLNIYNLIGQKVRTLVDGEKLRGVYSVEWDGQNDFGEAVTSGVYFYRLVADSFGETGDFVKTRKMILLR